MTKMQNSSVAILVLAYQFQTSAMVMTIVEMAQTSFTAVPYITICLLLLSFTNALHLSSLLSLSVAILESDAFSAYLISFSGPWGVLS